MYFGDLLGTAAELELLLKGKIIVGKNSQTRGLRGHCCHYSFSEITNVGTIPPPAVTLASSFIDSRVNADPTTPLNKRGSRSTSCSTNFHFPRSSSIIGNVSLAVLTRSCTR